MTNIRYEQFPALLREQVEGFEAIYAEHIDDYDEVLPHVLIADLLRFLTKLASTGRSEAVIREALRLLEAAASSTDPRLRDLVAVSFLENLEPDEPGFEAIRAEFGPALEAEYQHYESARTRV